MAKKTITNKKTKLKKGLNTVKISLKAGFNNNIITLTDMEGNVLAWSSAGKMGFKGSRKSTPFAAQKATEEIVELLEDAGVSSAHLVIWGAGMGRDSFVRTIQGSDLSIESITDKTGFAHGGPRMRSQRNG